MNMYEGGDLGLLTDLYELTMMQGYFRYRRDMTAVFDLFFRYEPFGGGYAVFAGLEPFLRRLPGITFSDGALRYLESLKLFAPEFLDYLSAFRFKGDIYAVEEGEVVFAREPLIRTHAEIIEAQLLESILLNIVNFQTLIATKAARITEAARGRTVIEFGLRRAQGIDGALSASRAAFIGGAGATSNVMAGRLFGIPLSGTMAHSWVMAFRTEREAFRKYAALYPAHTILLVDTYDTLGQGIPEAVKVLRALKTKGITRSGIRLDSGDLEYLSMRARALLDRAGLREAKIVASNELDERIIEGLVERKAPIDYFGVGTKLVTAQDDPALSGIYKLVAHRTGKRFLPSIKISDNPEKTTDPHVKNVLRVYDDGGMMRGDLVFLETERRSLEGAARRKLPLDFFPPGYGCRSVKARGYARSRVLLRKVVGRGEPVYDPPGIREIQRKARENLAALPPSYKRLLNPHRYTVSLTKRLRDMKLQLIKRAERRQP